MIRYCLEIFPAASTFYAPVVIAIALIGIFYGGFVALKQTDMRRLFAYSSMSHFGFIALGIFAVSIFIFALSATLWLSLVALWIYGASDMISVNIRSTLIQLATPDELRGRVSAVNMLFIGISNEMGDFRSGSVAALFGPVATVLAGAGMALVVAVGGSLAFTKLRRLDKLTDAETDSLESTP